MIDELLEGYAKALRNADAVLRSVAEAPIVHTVSAGETLWDLQQKYKVPWESIKNYNNLPSTMLSLEQKIKIPPADQDHSGLPSMVEGQPFDLNTEVAKAAAGQGVDAGLLSALVQTESRGDPAAVSPAGAIGLTQLMPAVVSRLGGTPDAVKDPIWNLNAGAKWLRISIDEAKALKGVQDTSPNTVMTHALMIYHAGSPAVQKWINAGSPPRGHGNVRQYTLSYPSKVLGLATQPK